MRVAISLLCLTTYSFISFGQCPSGGMQLSQQATLQYALNKQSMCAARDINGKPYMYVAAKERGLVVYDINNLSYPQQVDSIPISMLSNMEVMNLSQNGNYLYLALGNHFVNGSTPGMAIIDVSNPSNIVLKDTWNWPIASSGAGIVIADGNYAYLGGMRQGLFILDISNKSSIGFVSQFIPSKNWPNPSFPDSLKYNARGMELRSNYLYLCYDAGGLRIIDVSIKSAPVEIGKYSNPAIYNQHRAYNNVVLDDSLAYIALDYCGMEVLNISNPANISQKSWWNPWQCDTGINKNDNWSNNNGHTNDIRFYKPCKLLFLSTGKSELQVLNVSNSSNPIVCDSFGTIANNEASWGVTIYQNQVYLTYIFAVYIPIITPFGSNWGGVKIIKWNDQCATSTAKTKPDAEFSIYPNPNNGVTTLQFNKHIEKFTVDIYDVFGQKCLSKFYKSYVNKVDIDLGNLPDGSYNISLTTDESILKKHISIIR